VFVEDKLFATLDPTTRSLVLPNKDKVLFTDTVGFLQKLPPSIVTAFRATLEELTEASILLHVVDLTSPNAAEQCQAVENILGDLGLADRPIITALNKIDLLLNRERTWDERSAIDHLSGQGPIAGKNTVLVSAVRKWGLTRLLELVQQVLGQTTSQF